MHKPVENGRRLPGGEDNTARVWDASTGQLVAKLEGHPSYVNSAAFSQEGQRVVTASDDHTAHIYRNLTANDIDKLLSAK